MEIVHISAECFPVAKVGGLADVAGALPKYLNKIGQKASVIIPFYHNKFRNQHSFTSIFSGYAKSGQATYVFHVLTTNNFDPGFDLFLIDIPGLFDRENIYSYHDDTERFIGFQIATLNWLCAWSKPIDVIHCHDQHTGFIPFMLKKIEDYNKFANTPTIFTIHNGEYQGQFGLDRINLLPPFDSYHNGLVEWRWMINPLASAIKCAWKVTTVSPGYLEEINHSMSGLEELLRAERAKSVGIINGIDNEVWNPKTDPYLDKNYSLVNVNAGKRASKEKLCRQFGLNPDVPLFSFIGRLAKEKGADILADVVYQTLTLHPGEQSILVLGSGEKHIQDALLHLEHHFKGQFCSYIGYNEKLGREIYAGSDFLLMPSRVEPCGLNQLYALRYGTIPIVRRTGGLRDTVADMGDGGFGFCHNHSTTDDVLHALHRAREFFKDTKLVTEIRKKIMKIDHSWEKSAQDYLALYSSLK